MLARWMEVASMSRGNGATVDLAVVSSHFLVRLEFELKLEPMLLTCPPAPPAAPTPPLF